MTLNKTAGHLQKAKGPAPKQALLMDEIQLLHLTSYN